MNALDTKEKGKGVHFGFFTENMPCMVALLDSSGLIQYSNSKFLSFTGFQDTEVLGKPLNLYHCSPTEYQNYLNQWLLLDPSDKWSGQVICEKKDRSCYTSFLEVLPCNLSENKEIHFIASSFDYSEIIAEISAHKKKEGIVIRERDKAQHYLDVAGVFMLILDRQNIVQFINEKGCKVLGLKKDEVIGLNWVDHFLPEREKSTTVELLNNIFDKNDENDEYFQNIVLCNNETEERVIIWHSSVLSDEDGCYTSVLLSGEDVTEMRQIDRMKSDLMNIVSHEIRTPLASIRGFSELMLHRNLDQAKMRSYLQTIHNESVRLSKFIDDFLDIQRLENCTHIDQLLELQVFDISRILQEVASMFQSHSAHQLIIKGDAGGAFVNGDYDKIKRLTINLISNAFKYSEKGMPVTISVKVSENNVRVTVEDKGHGIPEDAIPQLFSKYYRVQTLLHRKVTGTGLGLAICKAIVEAHNGRIWVESELNVGSRFIFELPRVVSL